MFVQCSVHVPTYLSDITQELTAAATLQHVGPLNSNTANIVNTVLMYIPASNLDAVNYTLHVIKLAPRNASTCPSAITTCSDSIIEWFNFAGVLQATIKMIRHSSAD